MTKRAFEPRARGIATEVDLDRRPVSSNPILEGLLGSLELTAGERDVIRRAPELEVRERAGGSDVARLTNPINIGTGRK